MKKKGKFEKKKGKKKTVKAGKSKQDPHSDAKVKPYAKVGQKFQKENKDVYNRADDSLSRMMANKGIPRHKVVA